MDENPQVDPIVKTGPVVSVGEVLSQTFSLSFKNLVPFGVIGLITFSPLILWALFITPQGGMEFLESMQVWGYAGALGMWVLQFVATAAMVYGVFQQLRGNSPGMGACVKVGFGLLFPVIGVALLSGLIVLGGLVLLIIPGIIFAVALYAAVPAAVVEKLGPGDAIKRSWDLTKGNRGQIFGVVIVIGIANWVVNFILQKIFMGALGGGLSAAVSALKVYMWVSVFVSIFFMILSAVASALVYYQLRVGAEGVDEEELASVFD